MSRPPKHALGEILKQANKFQCIKKGCEALGTTEDNFYTRCKNNKVKVTIYKQYGLIPIQGE